MSKAANMTRLSELHAMLTEVFIAEIAMCKEEGIPMASSTMAVIVTFLKNNNITAEATAEDLMALRDEFKQDLESKRSTRAQSVLAKTAEDELLLDVLH